MRLILILGPAGAICAGAFAGFVFDWSLEQLFNQKQAETEEEEEKEVGQQSTVNGQPSAVLGRRSVALADTGAR